MRTAAPLRPLGWGLLLVAAAGCGPDYKLDQVPARIVVSPDLADFGLAPVGETLTTELTLTSVSGPSVQVVALDLLDIEGAFFTVDGELPTVPAGGTATLPVTYAPLEDGYHLSELTITTDEAKDNDHVVDLRATAGMPSAQVFPLVLDFGPVAPGSTATGAVVVANDGIVDVTVADALTGSDVFSVTSAVPITLATGESTYVTLEFAPTDADAITAQLTFDLGAASAVPITLRGNACETGSATLYDVDGDGYTACGGDCADDDADAHPGAAEVCDGIDADCDGTIDEGTSCADDDGDGVSEDAGDCNDGAADVSPAATEDLDNGIDDDCDGVIDYGTVDDDGDGYAAEGGDCDPASSDVYPGAPELTDGVDNDCDGVTDEGTTAYDDDGDGITESAGDCDDTDATVYPRAAEGEDGVDDDCDGTVDEGTSSGDDDGDGFTEVGGDCDDASAAINPGAEETSNGIDDNCDGVTE